MKAAIQQDPIERVRRFATSQGWWSPEHEAKVLGEIRTEIDEVQRHVEEMPRPAAPAIFDHVYAAPPLRLLEQRAAGLDPNGSDYA